MTTSPDFKAIVRNTGLKSTPSRIAVLKHLSKHTTPVSHAELVEQLAEMGFDRATIFRNLTDLSDAGLLSRIDVGDHIWRFELKTDHPHFVCTDCGDVECLTDFDMKVTTNHLQSKGKVGSISEVLLKGHCEDCGV